MPIQELPFCCMSVRLYIGMQKGFMSQSHHEKKRLEALDTIEPNKYYVNHGLQSDTQHCVRVKTQLNSSQQIPNMTTIVAHT